MVETLDSYYAQVLTGSHGTDYLELELTNSVQHAAFLLNVIYDSGYGFPKNHIEPDPLEAAWFWFHQVV